MNKTPFIAFKRQEMRAAERGIEFNFKFEEWCNWWQLNLGPDWMLLRGRRAHDYVMGRIGDEGAYEAKNVICITAAQNLEQRRKFAKQKPKLDVSGKRIYAKLDATKAKKIYKAGGSQ